MARSLRVCSRPGCTNTTARGLCATCSAAIPEKPRLSARQRGYDTKWDKARAAFLAKHRFCECPEHKGKPDAPAANTVDHIIPHKGNRELFWRRSNWRASTRECNASKCAREEGGFGNPTRLPEDRIPQRAPVQPAPAPTPSVLIV